MRFRQNKEDQTECFISRLTSFIQDQKDILNNQKGQANVLPEVTDIGNLKSIEIDYDFDRLTEDGRITLVYTFTCGIVHCYEFLPFLREQNQFQSRPFDIPESNLSSQECQPLHTVLGELANGSSLSGEVTNKVNKQHISNLRTRSQDVVVSFFHRLYSYAKQKTVAFLKYKTFQKKTDDQVEISLVEWMNSKELKFGQIEVPRMSQARFKRFVDQQRSMGKRRLRPLHIVDMASTRETLDDQAIEEIIESWQSFSRLFVHNDAPWDISCDVPVVLAGKRADSNQIFSLERPHGLLHVKICDGNVHFRHSYRDILRL